MRPAVLQVLNYLEVDIFVAERLILPYWISILVKLNSIIAARIIHLVRTTFIVIFIYLIYKVIPIAII